MAELNVELVVAWVVVALTLTAIYVRKRCIYGAPAAKHVLAVQLGLTGGIAASPFQGHEVPFYSFWGLMLTPIWWWIVIALARKLGSVEQTVLKWKAHVIPALYAALLGSLVARDIINVGRTF